MPELYSSIEQIINIDGGKTVVLAITASGEQIFIYDESEKLIVDYTTDRYLEFEKSDDNTMYMSNTLDAENDIFTGTLHGKRDIGLAKVKFNLPQINILETANSVAGTKLTSDEVKLLFNASATASDGSNLDSSLINVDLSAVDWLTSGKYTVEFSVTDTFSRTSHKNATLVLTGKPMITADSAKSSEVNTALSDAELISLFNVVALDSSGADISSAIVVDQSAVDYTKLGTYSVTFNVTDSSGNKADESKVSLTIVDTTAPVITADKEQSSEINVALSDAGLISLFNAKASDNYDTSIDIKVDQSAVDYTSLGTYPLTFSASDSSGNTAIEVMAKLNIVDVAPISKPTITADSAKSSEVNTTLSDAELISLFNVVALDSSGADISSAIVVDQSAVDYTKLGTYSVTFNVTDSSGNKADESEVSLTIVDTTAPVITADKEQSSEINVALSDAELISLFNVKASDNYDTSIDIKVDQSAVDYTSLGTYPLTFSASDSSGNKAVYVTANLKLENSLPPVNDNNASEQEQVASEQSEVNDEVLKTGNETLLIAAIVLMFLIAVKSSIKISNKH